MSVMVLDASMALSLAFEDECDDESLRVFDAIAIGGALVPPLWTLEVANILGVSIRHGRISKEDADKFLVILADYPIETCYKPLPPPSTFLDLARLHKLTAYDASYLRLATTTGLPLASKDGPLNEAAKKAGVKLFT